LYFEYVVKRMTPSYRAGYLLAMNPGRLPSWTPARRALLGHYDEHRRDLPWRGETDPYRILVSEVMLQQTRVETVLGYYGPWLERFPDLESLAAADADEVLEAWEGLGYYRRARNLHRVAQVVRERPDASLPGTYAELRELPGLGEYTAGAVASIAFGEAVPAADGNVRRVLARLFDRPTPTPRWLRDTAVELVDPERPGDWNQALMELGATVCTPRSPKCHRCPVAEWCAARDAGTQDERPARVARRPPRRATFAVAVLHCDGRVLLERRPEGGLLGGMWAFPEVELEAEDQRAAAGAAFAIAERFGVAPPVAAPEALPACEHKFTHLHATYLPYLVESAAPVAANERMWLELAEPSGVALPVAQRRILGSATDRLTSEVA
jgi:A/G-specific adenine glycosylase